MISKILDGFKLNPKEKLLYRILSERGAQPASRIAKLAELPRNTVRGILDKLVSVGLVIRSTRNNTNIYEIEGKEQLLKCLKLRLDGVSAEIQDQMQIVENYGDEISKLKRPSSTRPKITFYDGEDGLKRIYEDTLSSTETLRSWASFDANRAALPRYFKSYYKRRAKKGLKIRGILADTPLCRFHIKSNKQELRESKLVPAKLFTWAPEIQAYDDKVNIVSWKDKVAVLIQSAEIATAIKGIFDLNYSLLPDVDGLEAKRPKRGKS